MFTSAAIWRPSKSGRSTWPRSGVWLFHHLEPTVVPNVSMIELNIGEPALEISPDEAAELFGLVVSG